MERQKIIELQLFLLKDTTDFFVTDPLHRRSVYLGDCLFRGDHGEKCAIGRYLPEPVLDILEDDGHNDDDVQTALESLKEEWPDEYAEMMKDEKWIALCSGGRNPDNIFARELQRLHDKGEHWTDTGMTQLGLDCVDELRAQIEGGMYVPPGTP